MGGLKSGCICCMGQAVMDVITGNVWAGIEPRDIIRVNYCHHMPGGHANNQALALRKLGKRVRFVGRVGSDEYGLTILRNLRNAGVDVTGAIIDPVLNTSVSIIIVDVEGEKTILQYQTGNNAFTLDQIQTGWIDDCAILSVGSLWTLPGLDGKGVADLLSLAREKGVVTVADTGVDSKHVGIQPIFMALKHTDYYLVGKSEALMLTGCNDPEQAAGALLEMGPQAVIVRMGADGCLVATAQKKRRLPALSVKPVDTVGASDNFTAGFLTKLSEGEDAFLCAAFGNVSGAMSTLAAGSAGAQYDYETVADRLRQYLGAVSM